MIEPLPEAVRSKLRQNTHPGLMLDKFARSWDPDARDDARGGGLSERIQKPALEDVVRLSKAPPPGLVFSDLLARRQRVLGTAQAATFSCRTAGPLTLHLARASALENAGICLHPVYGFTYLPASGLKGMARSYAETVWFPTKYAGDETGRPKHEGERKKAVDAWRCIEAVFGWAANSDNKKPWKPREIPGHDKQDREHCGAIVFHDAWPLAWPKLIVDILNNHHAKYYQGQGDDPPGDWENPVPVYFLAVEANTTFEFAVAKRRPDVPDPLLGYAREWLLGALCHLGAGAKTNSGYGTFQPVQEAAPPLASPRHCLFESDLTLITPAFLAGANQRADDCDLRPATLRGLLRWWWRTMHAGFLDVPTLRALEAAIWGDTKQGGAIRISVQAIGRHVPTPYQKADHANMRPDQKASDYGIPDADPRKTTQGLWYASYGMDERDKRRYYLDAGSTWRIKLTARNIGRSTSARQILDQAKAALWLLCTYGGVGSKSRKGFGSLRADSLDSDGPVDTAQAADELRKALHLPNVYQDRLGISSSLAQALRSEEVLFRWPDVWSVLDQVGFAYQAFAKTYKHRFEKRALGLPRRADRSMSGHFSPLGPVKQLLDDARRQRREDNVRHASPIHIHVSQVKDTFVVRATAFPAAYLPDSATSQKFLQEFLEFFTADLKRRSALPPPAGVPARTHPRAGGNVPDRGAHPPTQTTVIRSLTTVTKEDLVQRLNATQSPQALFRVQRSLGGGRYEAQLVRTAPKIATGFQPDGGWKLVAAPEGLPAGAFVLVVLEGGRDGRFQEAIGLLPGPPRPPQQRRGPPRR